jgi:phosphate starvation-inducible PhoH-like protein
MSKKFNQKSGSSLLLGHIELTEKQQSFFKAMSDPSSRIVFLSGPAGTAKTFLSAYTALSLYNQNRDLSILYLRSVVESADRGLGFLKGDMDDKFGPYMAPLEDKIDELLNDQEKSMLKQRDVLEAAPINFIRGQSWRDRVVIVDEAQNMSAKELTTVLTRIGRNTKIFLCGDTMQSDIRSTAFKSFCHMFGDELSNKHGIYHFAFGKEDIMRDKIISYLVERIEKAGIQS